MVLSAFHRKHAVKCIFILATYLLSIIIDIS